MSEKIPLKSLWKQLKLWVVYFLCLSLLQMPLTTITSSANTTTSYAKNNNNLPQNLITLDGQEKPAVLIRAEETSETEFSAYTKAEIIKTYAQHQLDKNRKTPRPIKLNKLLKQAQMQFLSHEPNTSKKTFRIITNHIHSFDWNTNERKIIFYALFRLAQLEKDLQKQKLLLTEALVFGMGLKLDLQIFPPPLTNLYSNLKKKSTFVPLKLKKLFPFHEIVLINGKAYSNKAQVTLPYGVYRVTALSSSHKSWTKTLSLSHLIAKKLKTSPFVQGSCQQPDLKNLEGFHSERARVLFPNFCVWSFPTKLPQTATAFLPADIKMIEEELEKPEQNKEWWEEEWLWLGTALAVGATTIFILSNDDTSTEKKKEKKPKVKIGF